MYTRKILACLLAVSLLLAGCQKVEKTQNSSGGSDYVPTADVEPAASYDWMAGESPVPNRRIGTFRAGVNTSYYAVSPTGIYYVPQSDVGDDSFIWYADRGSDTFIKLCGRPDCTHTTSDCNAYLYKGNTLSYYNGYLYAVCGVGGNMTQSNLIRMEPDGSNHVQILDLLEFAKEHDGDAIGYPVISEGYFQFAVMGWEDNGDGGASLEWKEAYYYALDGSMKEPQPKQSKGLVLYQCGDVLLAYQGDAQNGGEYGSYWDWDPKTDTMTFLTDHPGKAGWYGETEAYFFRDGAIHRLTYETKTDEVMVETGLKENYYLFSFPDCLVLAAYDCDSEEMRNLYIYNWEFELVETIPCAFLTDTGLNFLLVAETADELILSGSSGGPLQYYIRKSEFGTGEAKIRAYKQK